MLHLLLLAFDKLPGCKLCDVSNVYEKSLLGDCQGGRRTRGKRTRGELILLSSRVLNACDD